MDGKMELLSPAGSEAALIAAVESGADAVYLGVGKLNARRRAESFSGKTLIDAVNYAHLRGVKVYAALNALVRPCEYRDLVESAWEACSASADAIIVQDWAAVKAVKEVAPDVKIHASTQLNVHNSPMVELLEKKGFDRVTLARELAIEEIERIARATSMEVEVFVHGALCFSYSGQCLMASMVGGRSGNRGLCPQVCRLPYAVKRAEELSKPRKDPQGRSGRFGNRKRVLSTRDLCGIRLIDRLHEMGIASIKIEGRMKSPEYVAAVTEVYRNALNRLEAGRPFEVQEDELDELGLAHSRGFTEGYLVGIRDDRLMSPGRSSDRGFMVGRVAFVDIYSGKVGISLQRCLKLGDVVEIWVSKGGRVRQKVDYLEVNGNRVEKAEPHQRAVIKAGKKRHLIRIGDRVFLVQRDKARQIVARRKVPLEMRAFVEEGAPLRVVARASDVELEVVGSMPAETARRNPVSAERVKEQMSKLGGTAYEVSKIEVTVKGRPSLSVSEINSVRRKMVESLDQARTQRYRKKCIKESFDRSWFAALGRNRSAKPAKLALTVSVGDLPSANAALATGADRVYLNAEGIDAKAIESFGDLPAAIRPSIGNVLKDLEIAETTKIIKGAWREGVALCDNLGFAYALKHMGFDVVLDYHVNAINGATCAELAELASAGITASVEADASDIRAICRESPVPVEVVAHGSIEVMISEHPVVRVANGERVRFEIRDSKGFRFPAMVDSRGRTHIYNAKELCLLEELPKIAESGAAAIRLLLELHSAEEISGIVGVYRRAIDELSADGSVNGALEAASTVHWSFADHTTGHFYRPLL